MTTLPATAFAAALGVAVTFAAAPAAALPASHTLCRDAIAKSSASYAKVATRIAQSCHKKRSSGTVMIAVDCNDVDAADLGNKLEDSREKMRAAVVKACGSYTAVLAQYPSCPAPAQHVDDGGASDGIDDFSEAAVCLAALIDAGIEDWSSDSMGSPAQTLEGDELQCQRMAGKFSSRLLLRIMNERRSCQNDSDQGGGDAEYVCDDADPRDRIAEAADQLEDKIAAHCSTATLSEIGACGDETAELQSCVAASADDNGSALIRNAYGLDGAASTTTTMIGPTTTLGETTTTLPGSGCGETAPACNGSCPSGQECYATGNGCACKVSGSGACAPATIHRSVNSRYSDPPTVTQLTAGWSGGANVMDFPDGAGDTIDVDCDENCENCQISFNVEPGASTSNCRCTSDPQQTCTVLNGSDPDSCGTLDPTCRCYFGSPLAISSGGIPVCVAIRIREDYTGTMNLRTGERYDTISVAAIAHLGADSFAPCPTCDGDDVANDGMRNGTCSSSNASCDVNGDHATFGPTSNDCLPSAATNISGAGLLIKFDLATGPLSLTAQLPCDTPQGALCPCRVCTGNGSLGCSNNADCEAAGAGVCTAGGGAGVQPNTCDGFQCGADGFCTIGPVVTYCDGAVHPDGRGFIPCQNDVDCQARSAGACMLFELARCVPDPIVSSGHPDVYNPQSSTIFCVTPTANPAANIGAGLPGPGVLDLDFDMDVRCQSDPSLVYQFPNGANCQAVATTTTLPLPSCEDAAAPVCGGLCPAGQVCTDTGGLCQCAGEPLPSCEQTASPICGGICAGGQICVDNGGTCACRPTTLPQCGDAATPTCAGFCPTGELCSQVGNECACGSVGVPTCEAASVPVCGGLCDVGQVCTNVGGFCGCLGVLPSCAEATAPICAGGCAVGAVCQDVGGGCQCVVQGP
ncbi:MAG TPA: hypothetical protein VEC57_08325 [Candidatus Limnocylindrales bacterium]|nr:hypothetical protein [Candidatus Limnocylindrales bacterium]